MDKRKDTEQSYSLAANLDKIAKIRAKVRENPKLTQDIEREIAERRAAGLTSTPAPEETKAAWELPPKADAVKNDLRQRRLLGDNFE